MKVRNNAYGNNDTGPERDFVNGVRDRYVQYMSAYEAQACDDMGFFIAFGTFPCADGTYKTPDGQTYVCFGGHVVAYKNKPVQRPGKGESDGSQD
jgi:hypothetical protein